MHKTKKAVIFGTGSFAEVVTFMLEKDSPYEVVAFTAHESTINEDSYLGKPLIPFEALENKYMPSDVELFVAIGYVKMNKTREKVMHEVRSKGYKLLSYISSYARHWDDTKIGDNVFIFEDNNIQPFVSIGEGTILWSGNHIGHHSKIGKYCFITSHSVISGHCSVGDHSFVGVNSTVIDSVHIAARNLIGAGATVVKNTQEDEVYVAEKSRVLSKKSDRFL